MTKFFALLIVGAIAVTGCQRSSPPGGHVSTDRDSPAGGTFTINVPALAVNVAPGETEKFKIGISRKNDFAAPVTVKVKTPAGLKASPDSFTFTKGTADEQFVSLMADGGTTLGAYEVTLQANPAEGSSTNTNVKVQVKESAGTILPNDDGRPSVIPPTVSPPVVTPRVEPKPQPVPDRDAPAVEIDRPRVKVDVKPRDEAGPPKVNVEVKPKQD